ncbi:MAG: enoyl-CoA hydratase [Chloroflexota bacterium]|nr:enoyl-CoA hydratase [Chloroflexota bacterium]
MPYKDILFQREGAVAILTLNRPEKLNALSPDMRAGVRSVVDELRADAAVRVLILTGAGRGFCSGADVGAMPGSQAQADPEEVIRRMLSHAYPFLPRVLRSLDKPIIGAINGAAVGAGFSLAMGCDIRIASENARFSAVFVRRGLVPDTGLTYFLTRAVGTARACELMFNGDFIDAREAERLGIVNKVVPQEALMAHCRDLAQKLAQQPPMTLGLIKHLIYRGMTSTLDDALEAEIDAQQYCLRSEDHKEAIKAFQEKREPSFKGR